MNDSTPLAAPSSRLILVAAAFLILWPTLLPAAPAPLERAKKKDPFTSDFRIEDCTFVNDDGGGAANPFFPLVPGRQLVFETEDGGRNEITTCLDDGSNCSLYDGTPVPGVFTVAFHGIAARVIEERESADGELIEISHNYFARCRQNGSVFYLGEQVEVIDHGAVTGVDGSWQSGQGGARPGVVMPGLFLLGSRYYQEVAPGVALDRAENTRMGLDLDFDLEGGGSAELEGCVEVTETTPLEKGDVSLKNYCPGIGLVIDDDFELVDENF
jgi:hypothetical protein